MIDRLTEVLREDLELKIFAGLLFVLLFLGSVQLTSMEIEGNSDVLENNIDNAVERNQIRVFVQYFVSNNMNEKVGEVGNISQDISDSFERSEYSLIGRIAVITGRSLAVIDPFYPEPCTFDSSQECKIYLKDSKIQEFKEELRSFRTNESLRGFAEENDLNVSEEFYANYSQDSEDSESEPFNADRLNELKLDTEDYIVNTLYLGLFGFVLASLVIPIYRRLMRDLKWRS